MSDLTAADRAKIAAAAEALALVEPGMQLGLGTGSTAAWFVKLLARRMRAEGLELRCVATSAATERLAVDEGLVCVPLETAGRLDLTVDGADEVDADLRLLKGGGGALLREKIVAHASTRLVVIADAGKRVAALGAYPLPVEVVRFAWPVTRGAIGRALAVAGAPAARSIELRTTGGAAFVSDEGHHILDLALGRIDDPERLAAVLASVPGVVEHGLFLGMAERVILGREDGGTETLGPRGEPGIGRDEAQVWAEELTRSVEA